MILYHGSNTLIEKVELQMCKPYKDFGRGLYCTTIRNQAELMAKRVVSIYGGVPTVSKFELDEKVYEDNFINIRKFEKPSKEWAIFVLNNRDRSFSDYFSAECNHDNKYDIVVGPIANDDLALLFRTF